MDTELENNNYSIELFYFFCLTFKIIFSWLWYLKWNSYELCKYLWTSFIRVLICMNMNYVGLEKSSNKISLIDRGILSQGSMKSIKLPAICTHLQGVPKKCSLARCFEVWFFWTHHLSPWTKWGGFDNFWIHSKCIRGALEAKNSPPQNIFL